MGGDWTESDDPGLVLSERPMEWVAPMERGPEAPWASALVVEASVGAIAVRGALAKLSE